MRDKKGILRCDKCRKPIEDLSEEQALADLDGHGWTNSSTAEYHACNHCSIRFPRFGCPFTYETYFAGRFEDMPDGTRKVFVGGGCYFIRDKEEMKR